MSVSPALVWFVRGDEDFGNARTIESAVDGLARFGRNQQVIALGEGKLYHDLADRHSAVALVGCLPEGRDKPVSARTLFAWTRAGWRAARRVPQGTDAVVARSVELLPAMVMARLLTRATTLFFMANELRGSAAKRAVIQAVLALARVRVVANSNFSRDSVPLLRRVVVCPPGISATEVRRADRNEGEFRVGMLGRIVPQKGHDRVIRALGRMASPNTKVLVVAGHGSDEHYLSRLSNLAEESDVALDLRGRLDDVGEVLAAVDLLVVGQLSGEPFGRTAAEAMMAGVPVAVFGGGGAAELVTAAGAGWSVDESRVDALAGLLGVAYQERAEWAAIGDRGRRYALDNLTDDAMCRCLAALLPRVSDR